MDKDFYSPKLPLGSYDFMYRVFYHYQYPFNAGLLKCSPSTSDKLHLHDFPQIWYCVSGEYRHYIENVLYSCKPGSLLIIPPGTGHAFDTAPEKTPKLICLQGSHFFFNKLPEPYRTNLITNIFLPSFSKELGFSIPLAHQLDGNIRDEFESVLLHLSDYDYQRSIPNISHLRLLVGKLFSLPQFEICGKERNKAQRLIESKLDPLMNVLLYINKNFAEKISSEELIKISMMSYSEFFKYFKKLTGVTFTEYIGRLRVRRALSYVARTQYSFEYIADLCGFGDRTYLAKLFKKYHGITMTEERARQEITKKEYPFSVFSHDSINRVNLECDYE